ncbi:MAG: tRNA (adenosine(37)-N6)-threonylcarbamoyltransferase complex transferase subunit TsaD [Candidatus Magasanikbacteria bacterium]
MLVLGIESSCDDTSVALLDCSEQGCFVIKELTASQIEIHKKYGGVVPEIAGRMHAEKIVPLIEEVLKDQSHPDIIAVTAGPGLITGLIVGVEAARTLSYAWNIPLVAVNHIEGHIHSVEISNSKSQITKIQYPALALVVSGGHTELIHIKKQGKYKIIGQTRDDAAGECFDKVAKLLDLPYPGGPQISKLAETGKNNAIDFPRPMLKKENFSAKSGPAFGWDFSFAGLKTSALYWLRDHTLDSSPKSYKLKAISSEDFCASFEQAIVDVLVAKTIRAAQKLKPKTIILAGGVSANKKLRATLANQIESLVPHSLFLTPSTQYSMDNASMIAVAGYYQALKKDFTSWKKISADPNWSLN